MKKASFFLYSVIFTAACSNNNGTKDSAARADSMNKARMDSPYAEGPVVTDEATASFMVKAVERDMIESRLGALAEQKVSSPRIRNLAATVARGRKAVHEQLLALAAQRNISLPSSLSEEQGKMLSSLSSKAGDDFEKSWTQQLLKDCRETIGLYEKAVNDVNDTDIKNFINNRLPKLKNHLDAARATLKNLK